MIDFGRSSSTEKNPRKKKMKLHFIQNEATPHNNALIRELAKKSGVELVLWYAREKSDKYSWKQNPTYEIQKANIYGDRVINWGMLFYLIKSRKTKIFQTGWGNPTTKMTVLLVFLLRLPYNLWFDFPQDVCKRSYLSTKLREIFYWMIKHSRVNIFCVGKMTIDYFVARGFAHDRLINLPVIVDVSKSKTDYLQYRSSIRKKYNAGENDLFLVAGSRLTRDKGYDLLIQALDSLSNKKSMQVKTLIIGQGEEKENLLLQIMDAGLGESVWIEGWMDFNKYRAVIANADVFVHPARFDAYGGGTLNAMIVGTPVVGSYTAGSTVDRIIDGKNGWLYKFDDIDKLEKVLTWCVNNKKKLPDYGKHARRTALNWTPEKGSRVLLEGLI